MSRKYFGLALFIFFLVLYIPLFSSNVRAYYYSTGYGNPQGTYNLLTDNGRGWTNPSNAYSNDPPRMTYAQCANRTAGGNATAFYNFGFNIPDNAIITNVTVLVSANTSTATTRIIWVEVRNDTRGIGSWSATASKTGSLPTTSPPTNYTFAPSAGLWGLTWNATTANNISIMANCTSTGTSATSRYCRMNWISVNITYYIDETPPIWQNQGTNDTDNLIGQGQAINLTAQGKDETTLDWAWLSTNESGSWKNYTTGTDWWNTSFLYRKQFNITGSTDGAQTNYQMKLNAYYSSIPSQRLLGNTSTGSSNTAADRFILVQFQAQETGFVDVIKIYSAANGNVKVALYSDNAGEPGTLLTANNSDNPCSASQWNNISISSTNVTKDTNYWIAAIADTDNVLRYSAAGSGISRGKTVSYSGFSFPDPAGSEFTSYTYDRAFDAFGILINSVSLDSHCQADFDDIRFTKSDGTTQLDYWIESKTDGSNATVWIEFDSIPASPSTATFYIYYNSSSAASASNGNNTFPFFDDFSGSLDTDKWTTVQGSISTNSGNLVLEGTTGTRGIIQQNSTNYPGYADDIAIYARWYLQGAAALNANTIALGEAGYTDNRDLIYTSSTANSVTAATYEDGSNTYNTLTNMDTGNWHVWSILRDYDVNVKFYYEGILEYTSTTNLPDGTLLASFYEGSAASTYGYIDWVFTRNYTPNEPTFGTWGNEQSYTYNSLYNSPMDMNDVANTWTWSNFTWQNSSVAEGTTVGWRIYYNDTSNNQNGTGIMTFKIEAPLCMKTVCSSGCDYTAIQSAINAASNGCEIRITDSREYNEAIVVNKKINLTSTANPRPIIYQSGSTVSGNTTVNITSNYVNMSKINVKYNGTSSKIKGITIFRANFTTINSTNSSVNTTSGNYGFYLVNASNNTITYSNSSNNYYGFYIYYDSNNNTFTNNTANYNSYGFNLDSSDYNTFTNNTATNNDDGFYLDYAYDNNFTNNTATSNYYGFYIEYSDYNTFTNNTATNNDDGFYFYRSDDNTFTNNTANYNYDDGFYLEQSDDNNFTNNTATSNYYDGFYLDSSDYNTFTNNTANYNSYGFRFYSSYYNTLTNTRITVQSGEQGIDFTSGGDITDYQQDIDSSNTINDVPILFQDNVHIACSNNTVFSNSQYSYMVFAGCNNVTVEYVTLNAFLFTYTNDSTLRHSNISYSGWAVQLFNSNNNTLTNNTISENSYYGIYLSYSESNKIYNNLFNNTDNFAGGTYKNYWNTTQQSGTRVCSEGNQIGGNYWSSPTGDCEGTITSCAEIDSLICGGDAWCCVIFGCDYSGGACSGETSIDCSDMLPPEPGYTGCYYGFSECSEGPSPGGYSDTCEDSSPRDGFCDSPLNLTNMASCSGATCFVNATDYLPLSNEYDGTPPIWQNQGTNDTDNIIGQGEAINLTAQGKDETALDWAWLSTNETSNWVNYTSWSNSTFTRCRNIVIANAGTTTLSNYPAYINLTYDSDMLSNYQDLRFYSNACNGGGTILNYEIENYTTSNANIWVKILSLPTGNTTISVYYKNNTAVEYGNNSANVWDSDYVGVWHLSEGGTGVRQDSTQYNGQGTPKNYTGNEATAGSVDGADAFNGTSKYITVNNSTIFNFTSKNFTVEAWVYPENVDANFRGIVARDYSTSSPNYDFALRQISTLNKAQFFVGDSSTTNYCYVNGNGMVNSNTWTYLVGVWNGTAVTLYGNGTYYNSTSIGCSITPRYTSTRNITIGAEYLISVPQYFNGTIDEVRISNTTRSSNWINQTYQMIQNQNSFVSVGSERNYTYGSPMNMTKDNSWQWSNFTWQNSSVTEGTIVGWRIYYNDTANNQNGTNIATFKIRETIPPKWYFNNTSPLSPATYSPNQNYQFNITFNDSFGISDVILQFNSQNYSYLLGQLSTNGSAYYKTITDLAANTSGYIYRWYANDTSNNWNSTSNLVYVINKGTPSVRTYINNITNNQTITYPTIPELRANTTTTITPPTFNFYRNNTLLGTGNVTVNIRWQAGTHNLIYNTTGNANWTSLNNNTLWLTVNKGTVNLRTYIDNATANKTVTYGSNTELRANTTTTITPPTFNFYKNNTLIGSGNASEYTIYLLGVYWLKYNTTGNANYSSAENSSLVLTVQDTTAPTYSLNQTNSTFAGQPTLFSLNWTDNVALSHYIFSFYNGSNQTSCTGTLNCDAYGTEASCNNCSQCNWTGGGTSNIGKIGTDTSSTGNSGTLNFTHVLVSGSNRMMVVSAGVENTGSVDITGVTYGGVSMNLADKVSVTSSSFYYVTAVYYLLDNDLPSDGTNYVNISTSGTPSSLEINGFAAEYVNMSQEAPESTDTNSSTSQTTLYDTVAVSDGSWVISASGCGQTGSYTHSAGQTEVFDFIDSSSALAVAEYRGASAGTLTTSSTWSGSSFNRDTRVSVSFKPASGNVCSAKGGASCSACSVGECNTNCSSAGCSIQTTEFVNDTAVAFGADTWSNVTKIVNETEGATIKWCIYANDTSNNWNGTSCVTPFSFLTTGIPDTQAPTYSLNSTNSTRAGTPVNHSLYWQDAGSLSGYIFSFDNCTGTLTNDTWISMTGTENWSNVTKIINSTQGCNIRWCVYANDTSNNWNGTSCDNPFSYTTTACIITVCSSGCDATTVQGGINLANNGCEVRITDSREYNESISINKSITLTSTSTPRPTIWNNLTHVINIASSNITISNLIIKQNSSSNSMYGIYNSTNNNNITIFNNSIFSSGGSNNYAIYAKFSNSNISYNNITTAGTGTSNHGISLTSTSNITLSFNNVTTTSSYGHGIYIGTSSNNITISNNNVSTSKSANGIYLSSSSNATLTNNNITEGTATDNGIGLYIYGTDASSFIHTIDESNTVNGKPIKYYKYIYNQTIANNDTWATLIVASSNNITITNVTTSPLGMIEVSNLTNSNISFNNLNSTDYIIPSIWLFSSSNNNLASNNITTKGTTNYGVYLTSSSNNNILTSNNITTSGLNGYGIYISASNNNIMISNNISTSGSSGIGIYIATTSNNNNIISNNISTLQSNSIGIYIASSTNNNMISNNISTSGTNSPGIRFDTVTNSNLTSNIIKTTSTTTAYGLYLNSGANNIITINTSISTGAGTSYDIYLSGTSNEKNYLINCTYNKTNIYPSSPTQNTKLYNQYYLDVYVNDTTGNPVNQATVTANDTNSVSNIENPTSNFSTTTASSGYITRQVITEFMTNGTYNTTSGYLYFNNYTVNASKTGYSDQSQQLNLTLTNSTTLYFTLLDRTPPIWQNQGTNDTDNIIGQGEAINLTAQGKDETALDWAWLSTNETGEWSNYTTNSMYEYYNSGDNDCESFPCNIGSSYRGQTFTPSISHKLDKVRLKLYRDGSPGTLAVSIRVWDDGWPIGAELCSGTLDGDTLTTDTGGAWYWISFGSGCFLEASTVYAITAVAPDPGSDFIYWRMNSTGNYSGGDALYSDEQGVYWYQASGDFMFEEYESFYNSPMNMTKDNNWQWSNFTWQNSSVSEGSIVGWRIYYNDTSNNQNGTDVATFRIRDTTPPKWYDNNTSPLSPATYSPNQNYQFNITFNDSFGMSDVILEFNSQNYSYLLGQLSNDDQVYYKTITDLSANTTGYNYRWYANDTSNNWNSTSSLVYVINKAATTIKLYINDTEWTSDQTEEFPYPTNINSTINVSNLQSSVVLVKNDTPISNPEEVSNSLGIYNYTAYFTGNANCNGSSVTRILTIQDTTPPTQQNQGESLNQVTRGQSLTLYAQGKDTSALDYAVLETNETGNWENKTTYSSPMDMNDATNTWTWSNFTWQNSSVTKGTIVGWRIYYNDTSGNENLTDTMTFTVVNSQPTITNLKEYPTDFSQYHEGQNYQFNITVTDADQTSDISAVTLEWDGSNSTITSYRTINSTSREYYITKTSLGIGTYNYKWFVNDTDNSWATVSDSYTVTQVQIVLAVNATEVWWNDPINISLVATRESVPIENGNVNISLNTSTNSLVCSETSATDANGRYWCNFTAPNSVGNYNVTASVYDPSSGQTYTNSMIITVKVFFGGTKTEKSSAPSIGCYDVPMLMVNPDGSIKKVIVNVCAWK
jgi:parallel beta-helix repeat protein